MMEKYEATINGNKLDMALVQIAGKVARMLYGIELMLIAPFPRYLLSLLRCRSLSVKYRTAPS